jgi:hypothetical protein
MVKRKRKGGAFGRRAVVGREGGRRGGGEGDFIMAMSPSRTC